jgi:F-type H+-transporting ATPase subunit delta
MKHRLAATAYAKALFAVAKERNETELVSRELRDMAVRFEGDEGLREFFARPWIPKTVKRTLGTEIGQRSGFSKLSSDFLGLLTGRGRTDYLRAIEEQYEKLLDAALGRVRAQVRAAVALTDEERRMLSATLAKKLGGGQVELEEVVDSAMLGGFGVESGNTVLDASLEEQLEQIRRRLATGQG